MKLILIIGLFAAVSITDAQKMFHVETGETQEDSLVEQADTAERDSLSSDTVTWSSSRFRYNAGGEKFSLFNSAVLTYKGAELKADTIYLDNKAQVVEAIGYPRIKDRDQPEITGYRLKYNHNKQIGEIYYGTTIRDNQMFNGVEVRRQKSGEIQIARGDFSTCDNKGDQHFYFYSRRMVLEPKKKVLARPVVMNIGDVPVALVPMLVVPLGVGRRSGFTRPKMGGDQAQGFYIRDLGYYWAINDFMDFQFSSDVIEGEAGTFSETNMRGKYNYHKRDVLSGNLDGRYFISEFDPQNSMWEINFAHDQNLTPDRVQNLKGGGRFVSSRKVLSEALNEKEALDQTANARLGYINTLDWNNARINVSAIQDYNLTTGKLTRELPNATFAFGAPLFPYVENDYWEYQDTDYEEPFWRKINYSYSGNFNVFTDRSPGTETAEGDTNTYAGAKNHLGLSGKYALLEYINVTPSVNMDHFWNLHSSIGRGGSPKVDFHPSDGRVGDNVYKFNSGVSANTKLYGIAQPELGRWEKIRHVVTPTIGFTWAPEIDTNRTFVPNPKLGGAAYQQKQKTVRFALGNDVDIKISPRDTSSEENAKEKKSIAYKILGASSSASYNFEAEDRKWSDISSNFRSEIVKHIPLNINVTHRLYNDFGPAAQRNDIVAPILMSYSFGWRKSISLKGKMNSGMKLPGKKGSREGMFQMMPWSASMNYGFSYGANRVSTLAFKKSMTHSYSGRIQCNPTPKWEISYNTAYDFNSGEFSKHSFEFHRTLHCWKMHFSWTPVGIGQGWRFNIYVIDIPDIKLESSQTKLNKR